MKLIVGLGNIGEEYASTRHNIGFMVLDAFAEASNISMSPGRFGRVGTGRIKNQTVTLLEPDTFMNLSGNAVRFWRDHLKIDNSDILVIVDDCALPFGTIRMRAGGSDAGHNGLKNIAAMLGSAQYPRLRFGIGNEFPRGCQVDFVLGTFPPEEQRLLPERIKTACEAIREWTLAGIGVAMNRFNTRAHKESDGI